MTEVLDNQTAPRRALGLFSGGLDSQLAVCVIRAQGLEVEAVTFESPFFDSWQARTAAERLSLPLHVRDFGADLIRLLDNPPHGFGSGMNPCIDCHALMLRRSGELMEERGLDFLFTGEVLGQRPMSQNRRALGVVERESGYAGLVVRPLSAAALPETEAERRGWLDRGRLLGLQGRSRRPQFQLAEQYGLTDLPPVAGGCLLTESNFALRIRDLKAHGGLQGERSVLLLRYGRHFRLGETVKLIVGRNERENIAIEGLAELYDLVLKVDDVPGPTGLMPITASEEQVRRAAEICARYADGPPGVAVPVRVRSSRGVQRITVVPSDQADTESAMLRADGDDAEPMR